MGLLGSFILIFVLNGYGIKVHTAIRKKFVEDDRGKGMKSPKRWVENIKKRLSRFYLI